MRVLWFTNIPLAPLLIHWGREVTGSGFWMHALVDSLRQSAAVDCIGVVYAGPGYRDEHIEIDGVDYYVVGQSLLAQRTGLGRQRDENKCLRAFIDIIKVFCPHIIHIHGTERFYGRLKSDHLTDVPTLVSIQGLMRPYAAYAWGEKTLLDIIPLLNSWEVRHFFPTLKIRRRLLRGGDVEEQTIKSVNGVMGRTGWDRSYCWEIAPNVQYFHVDEMIRPEFFSSRWSISKISRHTVYTTARLTFLKGMHVFIDAMAILKQNFPDLEVWIAGAISPTPEAQYLMRLVKKRDLSNVIRFLGWIPGPQIVDALLSAHCYVNTSFIENSCNSLQEAMLLGCPCVTTFTGGMPSLLQHRSTGLMAPSGCTHMFADAVREIFESDALCESLSTAAREVALVRHNPERILAQLVAAYNTTIEHGHLAELKGA